jgi:hypothetical protein
MNKSAHSKKPYLVASLIWLVAVVIFFSPVFFQGKVIAPLDIMDSLLHPWATAEKIQVHNAFTYDAITQYLPYDYSVYQSLRQDGYIGWNPYTHSGTSIVENTMICPGDWHHQLYRFLPFWTGWNAGIILHFTIAGLGMLLLLRDQKIPATQAMLGVIAFGFYSQFILWINHRWVLGAMCWAPWILWSLLRARKSGKIIHLPSVAFIALAFRGGHLQACVFVVLLVAVMAFHEAAPKIIKRQFREAIQILLPYTISGVLASALTLDVIIGTVPSLLEGNKSMGERSFAHTLLALPTLATSILPTIMGTPQSLDLTKLFKIDLFSIKFMGATALVLAVLGLVRREAPLLAKCLFIVGILVPFTPPDKWLYSRFTVVFALGAGWLAAWYLSTIASEPSSKIWKRVTIGFSLMVAAWAIGSLTITLNHAWIEPKVHESVLANLPAAKASRETWMLSRADHFLKESMIWYPPNLIFLTLISIALFACSRIHNQGTKNTALSFIVALCALGELLTFSKTWITFSEKPETSGLYHEPSWAKQLKNEVGQGTVLCVDRSDFDYMQLNTPSAYGIRFAEGYETVTPSRINPYSEPRYDTNRCAEAGVSHLLLAPEKDPGQIVGWDKVSSSEAYVLYKNPEFKGIALATLASGAKIPVPLSFDSANRRTLRLTQGISSVSIAESYNPGWQYSINGSKWQPVMKNEINGISLIFQQATQKKENIVKLQYHPAYQSYYRPIMGLTALCLIGFSVHRRNIVRRLTNA